MKKIYLIFIVAYLAKQLKANVYVVKMTEIVGGDPILAYTSWDDNGNGRIYLFNDLTQGEMKINVGFVDNNSDENVEVKLDNPCNMDSSTEKGTLAAIFWGIFGIESCPIQAGNYESISEFKQTGIIETMSEDINEGINIWFELASKNDRTYFLVSTDVRLVEKEP